MKRSPVSRAVALAIGQMDPSPGVPWEVEPTPSGMVVAPWPFVVWEETASFDQAAWNRLVGGVHRPMRRISLREAQDLFPPPPASQ